MERCAWWTAQERLKILLKLHAPNMELDKYSERKPFSLFHLEFKWFERFRSVTFSCTVD
jgi:hypothetical protein